MRAVSTRPQTENRPLHRILWMLGSGLCFVGVTGIVRYLGKDMPAAQSAFIRFGWGVVFLAPGLWALRSGLPAGAARLFAGRGMVHAFAVVFWFYAMARLPLGACI
ncbi:MAG: hypothetical protein RLZZ437_407 [Pseudomonadota bacterium]|jgi:drug/metabolite transporter (DMT)-like permease